MKNRAKQPPPRLEPRFIPASSAVCLFVCFSFLPPPPSAPNKPDFPSFLHLLALFSPPHFSPSPLPVWEELGKSQRLLSSQRRKAFFIYLIFFPFLSIFFFSFQTSEGPERPQLSGAGGGVSGTGPGLRIKARVIIILIKNPATGRRLEKVTKHPRVIYGLGDVVTSRVRVRGEHFYLRLITSTYRTETGLLKPPNVSQNENIFK